MICCLCHLSQRCTNYRFL